MHLVRDVQEAHETLEMARGLLRLSTSERGVPAKKVPDPRDVPALTPRQLEVLELLGTGKSVREIGTELYLSQATVRNHVVRCCRLWAPILSWRPWRRPAKWGSWPDSRFL